jgi:hypothetical protein
VGVAIDGNGKRNLSNCMRFCPRRAAGHLPVRGAALV